MGRAVVLAMGAGELNPARLDDLFGARIRLGHWPSALVDGGLAVDGFGGFGVGALVFGRGSTQ
jgi:hypothetical protein